MTRPSAGTAVRRLLGGAVASAILAVPLLVTTATSARAACVVPEVVAHRGSGVGPLENSLAAVDAAVSAGAHRIEFDVRTSSDGVLLLMHDGTVDRTTNGTGSVGALPWSVIHAMRIDGDGERVPSLFAFLAKVATTRLKLLLEIKAPMSLDAVQRVVRRIYADRLAWRTTVHSFSPTALEQVRAYAARYRPSLPQPKLALLRVTPDIDPVKVATGLHLAAYELSFASLEQDPGLVASLHQANVRVAAWTPDTSTDWAALADAGVDSLITNDPAGLISWERSRCG